MITEAQAKAGAAPINLHGVFSTVKHYEDGKAHKWNVLWAAKMVRMFGKFYNYTGAAEIVAEGQAGYRKNTAGEKIPVPTIRVTPDMLHNKSVGEIYMDQPYELQSKGPIFESTEVVKAFEAAEKVEYRLMMDDKGTCDLSFAYGYIPRSDFDYDDDGDTLGIPLDTLGRCYGCTGIQHKDPEDNKWKFIIG